MIKTFISIAPPASWTKNGVMTAEAVLIAIVVAIALLFLQALLVMIFWNLTLPHMFAGVPCITFWQALGLVLLVAFLFG